MITPADLSNQKPSRTIIFVYILGSWFFSFVATCVIWWCWIKADEARAKAIALQYDDTFNVALNGKPDVKFSSRVWLKYQADPTNYKYKLLKMLIDRTFWLLKRESNHCHNSYLGDRARGSI